MKLDLRLFSLVAAVAGMLATTQSAYADRVEVGLLKCEVEGGIGFVFGSTKALDCVFYKQGGRTEAYGGRINKFGVDLGATAGGVIAWSVLALTSELPPGELAGNFVGANAEVSAGVGGGADLLVGGSRDTVVLQPLSLKGQVGLNFAVGVAQIELYPLLGGKDTWRPRPVVSAPARTRPQTRFFAEEPHYGCGSYYILRPGDTISMISRMCGVEVATLLKANPDIANVRKLPVGLVIKVPAITGHPGAYPCDGEAILQRGEHLDQLAWRCGVTLHNLIRANPVLRRATSIQPGLVLRVPNV